MDTNNYDLEHIPHFNIGIKKSDNVQRIAQKRWKQIHNVDRERENVE